MKRGSHGGDGEPVLGASPSSGDPSEGGIAGVMRALRIPQISRMTTKTRGTDPNHPEPNQQGSGDVLESPQVEKLPGPTS